MSFACDFKRKKGNCGKKPYMECFYQHGEEESYWCYLCFWHYIFVRFIRRDHRNGYAKVDTDREVLERIQEEIWDIETDLMDIKEKLGIKDTNINLKNIISDEPLDTESHV